MNKMRVLLLIALGVLVGTWGMLAISGLAQAETARYVKPNGTGDGTSWATASGTLQEMIDTVAAHGGGEVWVAAGTYSPGNEQTDSFHLMNNVAVYGGFPAFGSPSFDQRDWQACRTVCSGEIGDGDIEADNCLHVFYHPGSLNLNRSAVLNGFIITGGYADGNDLHRMGGGMHNMDCSPSIVNCVFTQNCAAGDLSLGGAMINISDQRSCNPFINNCTFHQNYTAGDHSAGGAITNMALQLKCEPVFANCIVSENRTNYRGGGMHNHSISGICAPIITNCVFYGNSSNECGGGLFNYCQTVIPCQPVLTNCVFWSNSSGSCGDQIYTLCLSDEPQVSYCNIQGGHQGTGNIDLPPMFENPACGDFHLLHTSPCIDSGNDAAVLDTGVTVDFEGDERIINQTVDMGVDEWSSWYYDRNDDQRMSYAEMISALGDHLAGEIRYSQMVGVLLWYLLTG